MTPFERVLAKRRLVLTAAGLLAICGAFAWLTMVRQEDPRLPDFWGQVVVTYPGADAETVERLAEALGAATGKEVAVKTVVDPSVIGGLVARVGDTVIDGSVRRRFEELRQQLSG